MRTDPGHGPRAVLTDDGAAALDQAATAYRFLLLADATTRALADGDTAVGAGHVRAAARAIRTHPRRQTAAGLAGGAVVATVVALLTAPQLPVATVGLLTGSAVAALAAGWRALRPPGDRT